MFGLLNLRKPRGVTSRDVVNVVQRLVRPEKVGHAGTLDPLATGVLIVVVGQATRLVEYVQQLPKQYHGTFLLGRRSDTDDIDGRVTPEPDPRVPTRAEFEAALPRFVGRIQQAPPAYSAIKQAGQRAYERARRGETVELPPRPVDVYDLRIERYEYPELVLAVRCGSGCYVRSIGRDLARSVGSSAVMSQLERTAIGPFQIDAAIDPAELTTDNLATCLQSPLTALVDWPRYVCDAAERKRLRTGQSIRIDVRSLPSMTDAGDRLVAVDAASQLLAILVPDSTGGWRADKSFISSAAVDANLG